MMHPRRSKRLRHVLLVGIIINALLLVCGIFLFSRGNGIEEGGGLRRMIMPPPLLRLRWKA